MATRELSCFGSHGGKGSMFDVDIASSNKCLTSSSKKLHGKSASLLVTSALLVETRSY